MRNNPIEHLKELSRDGGWRSRKFALTIFTQALIFFGSILASKYGLITGSYDIMVGGLIAALTVYLTGQAYSGAKITGQVGAAVSQMVAPPDPTPPPKK